MFGLTRPNTIANYLEDAIGSPLTEQDLTLLNGAGAHVTVEAGAPLIVEGSAGEEALLILDGTAAVTRGDDFLAGVTVGDLVGECSLMTGEPRNATVTATTDVTALKLTRQEFAWMRLFSINFGDMATKLAEARQAA